MTAADKASAALASLKDAILEHLADHADGLGNSQIARDLGLESDSHGKQKNYLSWSVIGLLANEGRVICEKRGRNTLYKLP